MVTTTILKNVIDIFGSVNKQEQLRLLRILKPEKARILAKKLDKRKVNSKLSEGEITEIIHSIRGSY
jgi:hypothetical protein